MINDKFNVLFKLIDLLFAVTMNVNCKALTRRKSNCPLTNGTNGTNGLVSPTMIPFIESVLFTDYSYSVGGAHEDNIGPRNILSGALKS